MGKKLQHCSEEIMLKILYSNLKVVTCNNKSLQKKTKFNIILMSMEKLKSLNYFKVSSDGLQFFPFVAY